MIIEKNRDQSIAFKKLKNNEVFCFCNYKDEVWMKIEEIETFSGNIINAVRLDTPDSMSVSPETDIIIIKAKLFID